MLLIVLAVAIVAAIGALLYIMPRLVQPTVPFGVRVPEAYVEATAVRNATRQYKRDLVVSMVAVAAVLVALSLFVPAGGVLTAAGLAPLAVWLVPFLGARRVVLAAKRDEQWFAGAKQAVAADTALRVSPPPFPWVWTIPAAAVVVVTAVVGAALYDDLPDRIPVHFGADGPDEFADTTWWSAFSMVVTQVLVTALIVWLSWVYLRGRAKADLSPAAPDASAEQYRRFWLAMTKTILAMAAGVNVTLLVASLMIWDVVPANGAWMAVSLVPTLLGVVALVAVSVRTGQLGHRLPVATQGRSDDAAVTHADDDAHWIGGIIYFNRDDPAVFVPKRFGVGGTVNFARPAVWVATAVLIAITVASIVLAAR